MALAACVNETPRTLLRSRTKRRAFWLVRKSQSKRSRFCKAASNGPHSSTGANRISGAQTGTASRSRKRSNRSWLCSSARVIKTRFPYNGDRAASPTGAVHLIQNVTRSALNQRPRHKLSELRRLLPRSARALPHILGAIHRAHHSVHQQLTPLDARPRADGYLAASLQLSQQRALRDDRAARFRIVQLFQNLRGFLIF